MKSIAVMTHKGGVGKTTLAVNLAALAAQHGLSVALIEIDRQGSSAAWKTARAGQMNAIPFTQTAAHKLTECLTDYSRIGTDLAILDLPPRFDDQSKAIAEAVDFILVPCAPSPIDLHAVGPTLLLADEARKPAAVVLNLCPPRDLITRQTIALITKTLKFPLAPVTIKRRADFYKAYGKGLGVVEYAPHGKAASEITKLFDWLLGELNLQSGRAAA